MSDETYKTNDIVVVKFFDIGGLGVIAKQSHNYYQVTLLEDSEYEYEDENYLKGESARVSERDIFFPKKIDYIPFTVENCPIGCCIVKKENTANVYHFNILKDGIMVLGYGNELDIFQRYSYKEALEKLLYSPNNGRNWLPFGEIIYKK